MPTTRVLQAPTLDPGLRGVMSLDYDSVLGVLPAVVDNGGGVGRGFDNGGDSGAGDTSAADSDAKDGNALATTGSEAHIAFLVLALGLLLTAARALSASAEDVDHRGRIQLGS